MQNKGEVECQKLNTDESLVILINTLQQLIVKYVTAWLLINLIILLHISDPLGIAPPTSVLLLEAYLQLLVL